MKIYNDNILLKRPVSVYDAKDKKLVLIVHCHKDCAKYIWNRLQFGMLQYIADKTKCRKNRFNRIICFRDATADQVRLLGDNKILCLDERFK